MTTSALPFSGRVALITGAASGIGLDAARRLHADGAGVVLADRDAERLAAAHATLGAGTARSLAIPTDVTSPASLRALLDAVGTTFGRLDVAVNAAGIVGDPGLTADCELENWERVIGVNLTGVFLSMKYEIPLMLASGGGSIVNISSVGGLVAVANQIPYTTSKFGVIGATKAAAMDYAARGIRVNAVCPGAARTPMLEKYLADDPSRERFLASGHPLGRIAEAHEIGSAILWLCSDASSFVTGAAIPVDGGYSAT